MRFAYIDSQGKEVGIPTVEALQLRIELGAITEETIFYDASKDRWDPAQDHEIFRTLSREIGERGEQIPRPPTPRVPPEGEDTAEASEPPPSSARPRAPDPFEQEQDPLADAALPGDVAWVEVELEDVEEPPPPPPDAAGDWDVDLGSFGSLDLASDLAAPEPESTAAPEPSAGPRHPESGEEATPFELRGEAEQAGEMTEDRPEPRDTWADGPGTVDSSASHGAEEDEATTSWDVAGDLELERSLAEEDGETSGTTPEEDLQLEPVLAELGPGPGPDWGDADVAGDGSAELAARLDVEDPSDEARRAEAEAPGPAGARSETPQETVERPERAPDPVRRQRMRRDPYDRRVQPPRDEAAQRRRKRRLPKRRGGPSPAVLAGVLAVVALAGVGTWFGWSALRGSEAAEASEASRLPTLPAELEPVMREVSAAAYGDMIDSIRLMASSAELPAEPDPDWLAGVYLANADEFSDVLDYWEALGDHLSRVRTSDHRIFAGTLRSRLEEAELDPAAHDAVSARALAGFRASAAEREATYGQVEDLVRAATELHHFLVGNGSSIVYEPAVGMSRDPVTEAVPANPALGQEMWERVEEIPTALENLGILDRVTTDRILGVLHERLAAIAVG